MLEAFLLRNDVGGKKSQALRRFPCAGTAMRSPCSFTLSGKGQCDGSSRLTT